MASFGSLPVELVQKIIHYLIAYDEDAPVIGHNAVDTDVFHWYKAKQASPENRSRYELLQALPKTVEEDDDDENNEDGDTDDLKAENLYPIHSLKQLRLTCRYLNQLCIPFLFYEVNLLTYRQLKNFSSIEELILIPYAKHINFLRLTIGRRFPVASILTTCYNLRSLSLYVTHYAVDCEQLVEPIRQLLGSSTLLSKLNDNERQEDTSGKLTSLGIYYQGLLNGHIDFSDMDNYWDPEHCFNVAATLLTSVLDPKDDQKKNKPSTIPIPIQALDLVTGPISPMTWRLMQTRLENLKSLTLRWALHKGLKWAKDIGDKIWDPIKPTKCAYRKSLTQLYLRDCDGVVAMEVPGLVQFFSSLEDFTIIACGGSADTPPVERSRGWSTSNPWLSTWQDSDAGPEPPAHDNTGIDTYRRVRALNTFRIEHVDEQEVMVLGTIPSRTLNLVSRQITKVLANDPEIFPCVKILRTFAGTRQDPVMLRWETVRGGEGEGEGEHRENTIRIMSLDTLCDARGIELRRDLPNAAGCRPNCIFV